MATFTPDQKIQIWNTVGTWVSGLASTAAVITALYFSSKREAVQLRIHVGKRLLFNGYGSDGVDIITFDVTNCGEKPVIINSVGWMVGKKRNKQYAIQDTNSQYPKRLEHGEQVMFNINLQEAPHWPKEFITGFLKSQARDYLNTLTAQVHLSTGITIDTKPENSLLDFLSSFPVGA